MDRRHFVRALTGAGIVALAPAPWWRHAVFASGPATPGPSPYGPLLAADANGLRLPAGFTSRVVAVTGQTVGSTSHVWHAAPDGGGCLADRDPTNPDGWIYVSNSERSNGNGGVGAIRFAADGTIVEAYPILTGTSRNCAGGLTPAGTWLSCEESGAGGQVFECDPFGAGQGEVRPALGSFNHEAAAVDPATGDVYLTEDRPTGRVYRFVPDVIGDLRNGSLFAASMDPATGLVTWLPTSVSQPDRSDATTPFDGGEGIFIGDGVAYFVTKGDQKVWELDLASSQISVAYDCLAHPEGALLGVDTVSVHHVTGDVYVGEDGGDMEIGIMTGVGADRTVGAFMRLVGHGGSEVTGVAFSPDGMRLYFSSQRGTDGSTGVTYEISGPFVADDPVDDPEPDPDPADPVTVAVTEASFVRSGSYANRRFRSPQWLQLSNVANLDGQRRPLLSAPIDAVPGPYASAMLRVHAVMRHGPGAHAELVPIDPDWSAATVTWNTQPAAVGPPIAAFDVVKGPAAWFELDVTDHLNAVHAAGQTTASFGLRQPDNTNAIAQLRGPTTESPPVLVLTPTSDSEVDEPPTVVTVPVDRDSFVRGGSLADTNYGWRRKLQVALNADDKFTRETLLAGELPSLPGPVRTAILRVPGRIETQTPAPITVRRIDPTWTNTAVTWNDQPALGEVIANFAMSGSDTAWYEVDVTAYVESLRTAGAAEWSVRLTRDTPGPIAFVDASNSLSGDRVELTITA